MPVLLVVAAVVGFVVIVSLLLLADLAERRHVQQLRLIGSSPASFPALSIAHAFDPDRSILWDSQLPVLQQLASAAAKGCPLAQLYTFYLQGAQRYPELYEGSSYEQWLAFLAAGELVRLESDRGYITGEGRQFVQEFVKCRVAAEGRAPASR